MSLKTTLLTLLQNKEIDFISKFSAMINYIRPSDSKDSYLAEAKLNQLLEWINGDESIKIEITNNFKSWFLDSKISMAFLQVGIASKSGLMSEMGNRVRNTLLPPPPSLDNFQGMLTTIFDKKSDSIWVGAVEPEIWEKFYRSIIIPDYEVSNYFLDELMYAMEILSTWVAAEEFDEEFIRLDSDILNRNSPFVALHREVLVNIDGIRSVIKEDRCWDYDKSHFDVLLAQCKEQIVSLKKKSVNRGISVSLTYRFERLEQILKRLEYLSNILETISNSSVSGRIIDILKTATKYAASKNSLREMISQNFRILSLSITNNSSHHGEHYIANNYSGYIAMLKSAAGAGIIIALMAINKIHIATYDLTQFFNMIFVSLNYGLGFVIIHLLGFTVATKQPAMTASTIASSIKKESSQKAKIGELTELFVTVSRSQFAAVVGNVSIALSVAMLVSFGYFLYSNDMILSSEKATHYLSELEPSNALIFAAIAGIWLFLSGLISGYFDNRADYLQLEQRYYHHPFLSKILSSSKRKRFASYMHENHGSIIGNFLFGVLLGITPFIGYIFQADLEIRHIAFSSANLGYSFSSIDMSILEFLKYLVFVLMIGMVNLTVSFALAVNIALKAKDVRIGSIGGLLLSILKRFVSKPSDFIVAKREKPSS